MMKDSTMSVADTEEEFMAPQVSSPTDDEEEEVEENSPFESMQTELHSRGAELTKAWSNLFSFITKYQAELFVKENSVEIAEKEIEQRKKQLAEMKPVVDAGNEEITQLQDDIRTKERQLRQAQSQLSVKERMLQRVQSDLSCNMEMLENSRSELLGKQNEIIRYRGDLERMKSELTIKQEQIQIKDNLLKKLQNQLMKENAELREQLELERRALQLEKQSHELTKRTLSSQSGGRKRPRTSEGPAAVIEIPDSPPTLDLSVEGDFGLSNIISLAESQAMGEDSSAQTRLSSGHDTSRISNTSQSFTDHSSRLHHMPTTTTPSQWGFSTPSKVAPSPSKFMASPSITPTRASLTSINDNISITDTAAMTSSDTFFPLSVSEDVKPGIDTMTSSMQMDSDSQGNMPTIKPGTPSSGTSDSNQGPVPVSGPIPSPAMSPGGSTDGGADGKDSDSDVIYPVQSEEMSWSGSDSESEVFRCDLCDLVVASNRALRMHRRSKHADEELYVACRVCGDRFRHVTDLARHELSHEEPMKCLLCDEEFWTVYKYRCHVLRHRNQALNSESYNRRKYSCDTCGKLFHTKHSLQQHIATHSTDKPFVCPDCSAVFRTKIGLKCHIGRQCYSRLGRSSANVLQQDECYFCHKLFGTRLLMKEHLATHTDENPEQCPICHKTFSMKSNRNKHLNTHVAVIVFRCDACLISFRTKSHLQKHMATEHHDLDKTTVPSETTGEGARGTSTTEGECKDKQTPSIKQEDSSDVGPKSGDSVTHVDEVGLETSGGDDGMPVPGPSAKKDSVERRKTLPEITWKIYECDFCRYAFISQKLLDAHRRKHTGEKPYLCSICGKGYQSSSSLSKHIALHPFVEKPKNTICPVCKKRFKSWCFLRDHLRVHSGERPFVCETCGKGFMSMDVLKKHRATHKKKE
ncbi:zinc finger protein 135-like isoform X1 [Lineus longissimus]|uniref:zinc finger protein 135-like isoform X1 n=1 Tax=Lineus longissimus TaxID=88925 RepID=UPI00315D2945